MKSGRLELIGHVVRMIEIRWPKMVMEMIPDARRLVCRLRRRWMDLIRLGAWTNWSVTGGDRRELRAF